jgi:hypothetical protein
MASCERSDPVDIIGDRRLAAPQHGDDLVDDPIALGISEPAKVLAEHVLGSAWLGQGPSPPGLPGRKRMTARPGTRTQPVGLVGLGEHHHVLSQLAAGQLGPQCRIDEP